MRISVEVGGFTDAAAACRSGNQIAAMVTESLSGKLAAYAGMAGDDATSQAFARSYDAAARESVATLAELTDAFAGLGRLLAATGANHGRAEAASAGTIWYAGESLSEGDFVRVRPGTPPSSLGETPHGLGMVETWILERVEGFVWPGADVDRLLDAAVVWRRTAASIADLEGHCDVALTHLEHQRSPEVPLAREALAELRTLLRDTAASLGTVASSCEEYADAVRATHERTLALLREIAAMIVEGVAVSALVGAFSAGVGAGAAGSAALARIAAQAPRFHALLVSLRAVTGAAAMRLRAASDELVAVRARASKFARVRDERGSIRLPEWMGPSKRGWLREHEVPPGHAIEDHVGKSVDEMLERNIRKNIRLSSSFRTEEEAEDFIAHVLARHQDRIRTWLDSTTTDALAVTSEFASSTGLTVTRTGEVLHPRGVRVVLIPNTSMTKGWQVLTAYPD